MRAFPGKLVVSIWCFYSHVLGSVPQDTKRGQKKKKGNLIMKLKHTFANH